MPLIQVIVVLIVVGVLLWLINAINVHATRRTVLSRTPSRSGAQSLRFTDGRLHKVNFERRVVVIAVVVWLLKVFGLWSYITNIHVGR